ncbi:MAG: DUF5655 domain-containing protein [Saprospiraceae bacterium]
MEKGFIEKTGKPLEHWIKVVKQSKIEKHLEIINFLKAEYGFTYGFANLVALKTKKSDAASINDTTLLSNQYKGKEHLKPIYDELISKILTFGKDIQVAPKKAYVSLVRKKQFVTLKPATKTRFEIGIILKGQKPKGKLESEKPNAMCTHKICIASIDEIDKEVIEWIKSAYGKSGK